MTLCFLLGIAVPSPLNAVTSKRATSPTGGSEGEAISTPSTGTGTTNSVCASDPSESLEIHVLGQVEHPGTFWIMPGARIDEGITCAGGISGAGSTRLIGLKRQGMPNADRTVDLFAYRIKGDLNQNPYLSNQDVIFVPRYATKIQIIGSVKNPGVYEILPTETSIADAIEITGGFTMLTDLANPVTLVHPQVNFTKKPATVVYQKTPLTQEEIKQSYYALQNGDIIVVNNARFRNLNFDFSTLPIPGEEGNLPTSFNQVFVTGDVGIPGAYPFKAYYTIKDYAREAGISKTSRLRRIYLVDNNGRKKRTHVVSPGDVIFVPKKAFTFNNVLQVWNTATTSFFTGFTIYQIIDNTN